MRQTLVELIVVVTFASRGISSSGSEDCDIPIARRQLLGFVPRIVPAPDVHGIAVVWQDSEAIKIMRFRHDCYAVSPPVLVNSTRDFWRNPMESGLSDAVGLGDGSTVVAWTVDGDVWVRVIRFGGGASSQATQASTSNSTRFRRAEVRIAPNPAGSNFAVAWSSWQEDGDGWGVYVRTFRADATPAEPEEYRVNDFTQHFQWRPQLAWCGSSLWAAWLNGTDGSCPQGRGDDCATGPFVKRLPVNSEFGLTGYGRERDVPLNGSGPIASALTCCTEPDCQADDASVFWLDRRATRVMNVTLRDSMVVAKATRDVPVDVARRLVSASRRHNASSSLFLSRDESSVAVPHDRLFASNHMLASVSDATEQIDVGRYVMTAAAGLLVLMVNDGQGSVYGQLLDFLRDPVVAYPRREIASGIVSPRAAWGVNKALVFCSAQVSSDQGIGSGNFLCMRRKAQWLVDSGGLEFGGKLALVVVLSLIIVFCCVRHCTVVGRLQRVQLRRRGHDDGRRRLASQARVRELREQLAQIPVAMEPLQEASPARPPARGSSSVAPDSLEVDSPVQPNIVRWTSRAAGDVCSICQNEVAVWVALRPCGHTACRQCVSRLVEEPNQQRCHLCRNPIEGVLPVYI